MRSTNAATTNSALSNLFTRYGFPEQVVSDNGSPFQSREYADFLKQNGIQRVTPYYPAANGQAERFVQTFKKFLKSSASEGTLNQSIQNFLLTYRNTQHVTTGATPAKLFLQRELRTRLALVRPDISLQVTNNQAKMKSYYDRHTKLRELSPGDRVLPSDYLSKLKWRPGSVSEKRAPSSYYIQLDDGRIWHRHIDDLLLGAPQKQSQVKQASSELVVPWTDFQEPVGTSPVTPVTSPITLPVTPALLLLLQ